jgi:uncharacterized protein YbjT (DUF2867 family)
MATVLVTGATGNVGSKVVAGLLAHPDFVVRAATRDPANIEDGPAVQGVRFDWDDMASIEAAVQGVDSVVSLVPVIEDPVGAAKRLADASRHAGVRHLVRVSTMGTDLRPGFWSGRMHREIDQATMHGDVPWTILQPGAYMDNFLSYFRPAPDGGLYLPWRDGTQSCVDTRDVADAAVAVLTGDRHEGEVSVLSGPVALGAEAIATAIARVRPDVHYVDVPPSAARSAMAAAGLPPWLIEGLLELHEVFATSQAAEVTDGVRRLAGHRPRTIDEFVEAHRSAF